MYRFYITIILCVHALLHAAEAVQIPFHSPKSSQHAQPLGNINPSLNLLGNQKKVLRAREDGTFKIVQFTDLHFGESFWDDFVGMNNQAAVLETEKPDLVIMTGDSVSGYAWDHHTHGWFETAWRNLTKPMIDKNVSWAFTFGNHDDQADLTRDEIVALDQTFPLSLTQKGPESINGSTNYILPVFSHDESVTTPIAILWMFDSSDNNCFGVEGWGCVYPSQIEWYKETSKALTEKYGYPIPGLAFFHIPVPEFLTMWNTKATNGKLEDTGVCCFSVNTGLLAAFIEMGDIKSAHCGHDHSNDFFGDYNGITLAYGRKSGGGGYGPPTDWQIGARVISLQDGDDHKATMKHWITQTDGSQVPSSSQPVHPPASSAPVWKACCGTQTSNVTGQCISYVVENFPEFYKRSEREHSH